MEQLQDSVCDFPGVPRFIPLSILLLFFMDLKLNGSVLKAKREICIEVTFPFNSGNRKTPQPLTLMFTLFSSSCCSLFNIFSDSNPPLPLPPLPPAPSSSVGLNT